MRYLTLITGLLAASSISAQEPFDWTGEYEGYLVCSHVEDNAFGQFSSPFSVRIQQNGRDLIADAGAIVEATDASPPSVYRGELVMNDSGDVQAGYLEECNARFAYRELVRIFPATPKEHDFGFAADTIFVTKELPGAEGRLMVEQCHWALTRVSTEVPDLEECN
ncbi:MAG: hypothetical protein AAGF94_14695 [Pseudomonadota bacterium]